MTSSTIITMSTTREKKHQRAKDWHTLKVSAALCPPKPKLSLMATFGFTSGTTCHKGIRYGTNVQRILRVNYTLHNG